MFYHQYWYLNIVCPNWRAIVSESENEYRWAFILPVKQRFGIDVIYQPFFAQHLGFLYLPQFHESELFVSILQETCELLCNEFRYIAQYQGHFSQTKIGSNLYPAGFHARTYTTHLLNLNRSYDRIRAGFRRDRIAQLKVLEKNPPEFFLEKDSEFLWKIFKKAHSQQIEGGLSTEAEQSFQAAYRVLSQKGYTRLYGGRNADNELVAGALFVEFGEYITYLFNAALPTHRADNHRLFFLNLEIQQNAGRPVWLDFESPQVPTIADFYASLGGQEMPFFCYSYRNLPRLLALVQQLKHLIMKGELLKH